MLYEYFSDRKVYFQIYILYMYVCVSVMVRVCVCVKETEHFFELLMQLLLIFAVFQSYSIYISNRLKIFKDTQWHAFMENHFVYCLIRLELQYCSLLMRLNQSNNRTSKPHLRMHVEFHIAFLVNCFELIKLLIECNCNVFIFINKYIYFSTVYLLKLLS